MKTKHLFIALVALMLLSNAMPAEAQKTQTRRTRTTTTTTNYSDDQKKLLNAAKTTLVKVQGATSARDLLDADHYFRCILYEVLKNPNVTKGDAFKKEFLETYSNIDEALDKKMEQLGIDSSDTLYNMVSSLHGS